METLEMPVSEQLDESERLPVPPVRIEEQEMDVAAFNLWKRASRPDTADE